MTDNFEHQAIEEPGEGDHRRREEAIEALLAERSVSGAARRLGVGRTTLHRWMKDPGFMTAYRDARRALLASALDGMAQACARAVDNLVDVMDNADQAAPRVTAARAIITQTIRCIEVDDLDARMAEIEKRRRW